MSTNQNTLGKMSNYRWTICAMLFFATTVNYLDRQVLSLTWKDFIAPEFHWTDADYGDITAVFSIVYAIANLFAGRFIDWLGTKKGYLWAIFVWSLGACLHAVCGWATEHVVGIHDAAAMISATGAVASTIAITSVYFFIAARVILSVGEAGNFPAAIKVTAEYFPKKRPCILDFHFQCRRHSRCFNSSCYHPLFSTVLPKHRCRQRLGNGVHRHRWIRLRLDGHVDVHV